MYFSDKITLRTVTIATDTDGYPTQSNSDTEVWANVRSVTRAEFYAANANSIEISQGFEVHVEDWDDQTDVVYDGKAYDIVRTYQSGLGIIELVCSDKAV